MLNMLLRRATFSGKTMFKNICGLRKLDQHLYYSRKSNDKTEVVKQGEKFKARIDLLDITKENRLYLSLVKGEEEEGGETRISKFLETVLEIRKRTSAFGSSWGGKPSTYHDPKHPAFTLKIQLTKDTWIVLCWYKGNLYLVAFTDEGVDLDNNEKDGTSSSDKCRNLKNHSEPTQEDQKDLTLIEGATWYTPTKTQLFICEGDSEVGKTHFSVSYEPLMSPQIGMPILLTALSILARERNPSSFQTVCVHFSETARFQKLYETFATFDDHTVMSLNHPSWRALFHTWNNQTCEWINVCTNISSPNPKDKLQKSLAVLLQENPIKRAERRKKLRIKYNTTELWNRRIEWDDFILPQGVVYTDADGNEKSVTRNEFTEICETFWRNVTAPLDEKAEYPLFPLTVNMWRQLELALRIAPDQFYRRLVLENIDVFIVKPKQEAKKKATKRAEKAAQKKAEMNRNIEFFDDLGNKYEIPKYILVDPKNIKE